MKKRVIDKRVKEKFMMDDLYLNGQARVCGWQATLVYLSLCRHANISQESFPSIKLMAEELDISRPTVIKGLSNLEKYNVIEIKKSRGKSGKWLNNVYVLIDKSEWKDYQVIHDDTDNQVNDVDTAPSQREITAESTSDQNQVNDVDTKETHIRKHKYKETHLQPGLQSDKKVISLLNGLEIQPKEIVAIMALFHSSGLAAIQLAYGNKSERGAVSRLLSSVGHERLVKDINALAARRHEQYCPVVTKPTELERKYSQVRIFLEKRRDIPSIGKANVPIALIIDSHKYD